MPKFCLNWSQFSLLLFSTLFLPISLFHNPATIFLFCFSNPMAETSNSVTGAAASSNSDLSHGVDQDSIMNYWCDIYSSSQDELAGPSILDHEWGYVFGSPSPKTKKRKKKDVGSTSTVYSTSDLSESLSAISAHLSLSSSGSSSGDGDQDQDIEKEVAGLMKNHVGILQDKKLDNSMDIFPSFEFDVHSLSSESDEDDSLSSNTNEDEIQALSTFILREGTQKDHFQVPELGMVFSSDDEAYEFYKKYAKGIGFIVRKGKVRRSSNGSIRERFFFCSKEGFRSKKQVNKITKFKRKETRTGCRARIRCTVENGKWVISQFSQEHNHQLDGFSKTSEPHLSLPTKNEATVAKDARATKCFEFGSTYVHERKINSLQPEDAQSLINYFRHMQVEDPSFFYAVQLDANGCMTNFFWTDGRSKIDYEYFGDVLILDTTFKMDKFEMICAPFWGLNHHQQYVLFGCAFLLDESIDSFCWLFETFMEAMRRCQPKTIFTDEGQPVGDAVKMVMPEAKHQLGLWYVRRNASKYLPTYYVQPRFESLFNKCISDCHTEEEFESTWSSLLEQFDLHKNHWLNTLYKSRVRWAYIFNKESFCAGIHCSDNIKSIFQNLMGETITLQMFVQQYFKAAEQQRREELYEDFHCNESVPEMTLDYGLVEKHAAGIYTHTVFTAFQKELHKVLSVALREISSNGPVSIFQLTEVGLKKSIVEYNCVDSSIVCSCKKYESVGVLCAHTLKVLNARNVIHIPPQYILKRWTKSAKDGVVADLYGQEMADKRQQAVHLLMRKALNVISKGVSVNESQNIVDNCLDMALKRVEGVLKTKSRNDLKTTEVHYEHNNGEAASTDGLGRRFDVNWMSAEGAEEGAVLSLPNGALSSFQMDFGIRSSGGGRCNKRDMEAIEAERASSRASDDEENGLTRKKLRLSKEQSAFLEESFKEHNTLNPKQKLALAKQLNLRPRQVEVWFQNRRARTKLKQTEVDCEYLKRCCETLTEENRRLQKELQELRALKTSQPFYMQLPATTLTMCPSCERVATTTASSSATTNTNATGNTTTSNNKQPLATTAAAAIIPLTTTTSNTNFTSLSLANKPRLYPFTTQVHMPQAQAQTHQATS